jgi:hypothetical protein
MGRTNGKKEENVKCGRVLFQQQQKQFFSYFNCDFFWSFSPFDLLGRLGFSSTLAIAIVLVLIFPIFLLSRLQEEEIISRRLVVANLLLSSFPIIFQTRFVLICSLFPLFFL